MKSPEELWDEAEQLKHLCFLSLHQATAAIAVSDFCWLANKRPCPGQTWRWSSWSHLLRQGEKITLASCWAIWINSCFSFLDLHKSIRTKKLHFKAYLCCSLLLPVPHHATCRDSCKQIKAQRNLNFVDILNALILSNLFQESHHLLNNWQLPVNLLRAVTVLICHNWRGPPASGLISQMCWWLRCNRYILSPPWLLLFLDAVKVEINVIYSWRSCAPCLPLGVWTYCRGYWPLCHLFALSFVLGLALRGSSAGKGRNATWMNACKMPYGNDRTFTVYLDI